jgi:anti-sigma-K factor RskA
MMDQDLLREQCEAYVLGALDGEERTQLQSLIDRGDPACLAALQEARELIAQVALMAPVLEPPPPLRSRVLSAIATEQGNVVSIASRRRPHFPTWIAVGVAAALAVFAFILRNDLSQARTEVARLNQDYAASQSRERDLNTQAERYRQVLAVLTARDSRTIRLVTTAPEAPQFRAYWSRPAGLVLVGDSVPLPAGGRTLQLWVVDKSGKAISAGVFQPNQQGQVVMIAQTDASPEEAAVLAISDEPAGGSPQPTTKPTWAGSVSD